MLILKRGRNDFDKSFDEKLFTIKLIKNNNFRAIYIKELNNSIVLRDIYRDIDIHENEISECELMNIALKQSEEEYMRMKHLVSSWKNLKDIENKPSLFTLCFHPVRHCNYECNYCFAEKSDYLPCKEIDIETAKKAIDFMIDDWGRDAKRYAIDISGSGEPLLRLDFIKEIDRYCEIKRKQTSKDIKIMFPCNGSLISESNYKYFENNINILIGISIDGDSSHNKNRKYRGKANAHELTSRGIDLLKSRNVGLAATITHVNEDVDKVYDYLFNRFKNADAISLNVVRDYDYNSKTSFYDIDIDNLLYHYSLLLDNIYTNILNGNLDYIKKLMIGTDTLGIYLVRVFSKGVLHKKRCGMSTCLLSVDHEGNLYTCSVSNGNEFFKVGNIYDGINLQRAEQFRNINVDNNKYCSECWAANICSGECVVTSYLTHKNINQVNEDLCKFRKGLIELSIQFANKLLVDNKEYYNKVLEIVKQRIFFEQIIDSGIWVIEEYIKLRNIDVSYTDILEKISSDNYGTSPVEVVKVLSKYFDTIDAYQISNIYFMDEIKFPAIAYINKISNGYYNYILIESRLKNDLIIRENINSKKISIPIKNFIDCVSDIIIFDKG